MATNQFFLYFEIEEFVYCLIIVVCVVFQIEKATVSNTLVNFPCSLVAPAYGWSGNMQRIMDSQTYRKANDPSQQ